MRSTSQTYICCACSIVVPTVRRLVHETSGRHIRRMKGFTGEVASDFPVKRTRDPVGMKYCELCKYYINVVSLILHDRSAYHMMLSKKANGETVSINEMYTCPTCKKKIDWKTLSVHELSHNTTSKKSYVCKICNITIPVNFKRAHMKDLTHIKQRKKDIETFKQSTMSTPLHKYCKYCDIEVVRLDLHALTAKHKTAVSEHAIDDLNAESSDDARSDSTVSNLVIETKV